MAKKNLEYEIAFDPETSKNDTVNVHFKSIRAIHASDSAATYIYDPENPVSLTIKRSSLKKILNYSTKEESIKAFYKASNSFLVPLLIGYAATGDSVAKDLCQIPFFNATPRSVAFSNLSVDIAFFLAVVFALARDNENFYKSFEHSKGKETNNIISYVFRKENLIVVVLVIFFAHMFANFTRNISKETCKEETIKLIAPIDPIKS